MVNEALKDRIVAKTTHVSHIPLNFKISMNIYNSLATLMGISFLSQCIQAKYETISSFTNAVRANWMDIFVIWSIYSTVDSFLFNVFCVCGFVFNVQHSIWNSFQHNLHFGRLFKNKQQHCIDHWTLNIEHYYQQQKNANRSHRFTIDTSFFILWLEMPFFLMWCDLLSKINWNCLFFSAWRWADYIPSSTITAIRLCLWYFFLRTFEHEFMHCYKYIWYLVSWNFHIIINWINQNRSSVIEGSIGLIQFAVIIDRIRFISEIKLCIEHYQKFYRFIHMLSICKKKNEKHWIGSRIEYWIHSSISVIDIWTLNI